jgi:hypothetical protein
VTAWAARAAALVAIAGVSGFFYRRLGLVPSASVTAAILMAYVWYMRPLYVGLPLNPRVVNWLVRARLLPPPSSVPASAVALDRA